MALNTFKYPNSTAPTTTLTFNNGHLVEDEPEITFNQSISEAFGGTPCSESWGDAQDGYPMSVIVPVTKVSTECDYADLRTFLITTINGATNSFVWTDENSVERTVKLMDSKITFKTFAAIYKKVTMNLRVL